MAKPPKITSAPYGFTLSASKGVRKASDKPSEPEPSDLTPLSELDRLLEEDWDDEISTDINIHIQPQRLPSKSPPSSEKPEPSKTTKTVTAIIVLLVTIIEVLRELGVFKASPL